MTEIKPVQAWAATFPDWRNLEQISTIPLYAHNDRTQLRATIGKIFNETNWQAGWRRARKFGWRVIPVTITPAEQSPREALEAFVAEQKRLGLE